MKMPARGNLPQLNKLRSLPLILWLLLSLVSLAACSAVQESNAAPAAATGAVQSAEPAASTSRGTAVEPLPTATLTESPQATSAQTVVVSPTLTIPGSTNTPAPPINTVSPTAEGLTPTGSPVIPLAGTATGTPTPVFCAASPCVYPGLLMFARPIAPPGNNQVDATYRFGSTQGKKRDPHHGVELLNPYGTPVHAAADGVVVVAGDDKKTVYGAYPNMYGNLVVIRHDLPANASQAAPPFPTPIYTLYGHLSEVLVKPGDIVHQGQLIGKVGMAGAATGSHLHFEVRLGENTYKASRNPELWLQPTLDDQGQPKGAIAGQVIDAQGHPVAVKGVVIQHLPDGADGRPDWEVYLDSYEEKALLGETPWGESFAVGELPAGLYRINFPYEGLQHQVVEVLPGKITEVIFRVQ